MKAPFPWFGGKSRVADLVWQRFGDVPNYVEPFAGSLAVLLARPHAPGVETVNDLDCYLANFWRAVSADTEAVAEWCDLPVNEADLHARHQWLLDRDDFRARMHSDPDFYDAKIAGWWVWGISQWIGSGWCGEKYYGRAGKKESHHLSSTGMGVHRASLKRPHLNAGMGVHRASLQLPHLSEGRGGVYALFSDLAARLRNVRVCCGDWSRVLGPSPTFTLGITGVFLDPPYSAEAGRAGDIYGCDNLSVAHDVRVWAIANGDNPKLRIALCGYEGEHAMPPSWDCVPWKANGGYASQSASNVNATRERIWFSPHCLGASKSALEKYLDDIGPMR